MTKWIGDFASHFHSTAGSVSSSTTNDWNAMLWWSPYRCLAVTNRAESSPKLIRVLLCRMSPKQYESAEKAVERQGLPQFPCSPARLVGSHDRPELPGERSSQ